MRFLVLFPLLIWGVDAVADPVTKSSPLSVGQTADGLVAAVEGAGATVFARVDHAKGAESVGQSLPDAELVVFGNPALGTAAMQLDIRAGLVLPLQVLIYADENGQTQMRWTPAEDLFEDLDIPPDAEVVGKINGALNGLTDKAMSAS